MNLPRRPSSAHRATSLDPIPQSDQFEIQRLIAGSGVAVEFSPVMTRSASYFGENILGCWPTCGYQRITRDRILFSGGTFPPMGISLNATASHTGKRQIARVGISYDSYHGFSAAQPTAKADHS